MIFSLNCLFLGEASIRSISVDISDEIIVGNNRIKYEDIKVSHVKSFILSEKRISYSPDQLNLWKVDHVRANKNDNVLKIFSTEDDIQEKLGGELMQPQLHLGKYFNENSFKDEESKSAIHIIIQLLIPTPEEEPLSIKRIIEADQKIGNKDKPIITMYKYIKRMHIQQFIRDKIETNLEAFENGSSRLNDYQEINLKQIQDGSFEVIHIFVQIFPESSLVHFNKRPSRDPSTGHYPRDPSHVNLVELVKSSAFDLVTVLQAIRQSYQISKKLLILLQLDEYQRDEYLIVNILRFISQLVVNQQDILV
ncbi:hypothetical protein C1645_838883 [Glomus cerebriforme]|uniref:Crinkler effector protein N-terminal domain-containing protein n=1 Tax=Glomus cerebriforme TaxID=658196 RepID=A0A397S6K6_9GLOM|nr:hypothetical protein C1645_838883 [Glomus cerebriforme]